MTPVIYGIPNCDSIRKARKWLEANAIEYRFVDVRQTPPSPEEVSGWMTAVGQKALVNKRSTTWKQLDPEQRQTAETGDALPILLAHPTLIKRPVLEYDGQVAVGFSVDDYSKRFEIQGEGQ